MRRRTVHLAAATAAALLATACAGTPSASPTIVSTPRATGTRTRGTATGTSPTIGCADRTLARMSEAQRIGQLFMIGLPGARLTTQVADAIRTYHFGNVLFVSFTSAGVGGVRSVTDAVQDQNSRTATAGVPFLVAANQEGGEIQPLSGPGFSTIPSAVEQGLLPPATLRADATSWGRQLAAAGVDLDLAPVLDVVPAGTESQNKPIGALHRGYGSDPAAVASHGVAFIDGMAAAGIDTTAKHFPGLGRVVGNTDFTTNVVDPVTTPDDRYLEPFRRAVDAGVPFVMVALATYTRIDPDHLAVFSPTVMGLLRRGMGFAGVIVSDELGDAAAVAGTPPAERAVGFISAGGDLIVSKSLAPAIAMARALASMAARDPAFRALVDTAALHVLTAKAAAGLLSCGP
jgi:beta-N-acetylhexosaminidase